MAVVTSVITIPSTAFAVREYRSRPRLEPRLRLSSPAAVGVINIGYYPAVAVAYSITIKQNGAAVWSSAGNIDYLESGKIEECDNSSFRQLNPHQIGVHSVVTLSFSLGPSRGLVRRRKISRRSWALLDPQIAQL